MNTKKPLLYNKRVNFINFFMAAVISVDITISRYINISTAAKRIAAIKELLKIFRVQSLKFGQNEAAVLSDENVVEIDLSAAVFRSLDHDEIPVNA